MIVSSGPRAETNERGFDSAWGALPVMNNNGIGNHESPCKGSCPFLMRPRLGLTPGHGPYLSIYILAGVTTALHDLLHLTGYILADRDSSQLSAVYPCAVSSADAADAACGGRLAIWAICTTVEFYHGCGPLCGGQVQAPPSLLESFQVALLASVNTIEAAQGTGK